jgi:hypothetical protein
MIDVPCAILLFSTELYDGEKIAMKQKEMPAKLSGPTTLIRLRNMTPSIFSSDSGEEDNR